MLPATEVEVACRRFSTTRLKWEAVELLWLFAGLSEGSAPRHLHYSILLTCFACSHCHRNWFPERSGGSFCSGASKGEDREERVRGESRGEKKRDTQRGKEKQREGEVRVWDQERKSERHCHWWVHSCHSWFNQWFKSDALSIFFPSLLAFDDWFPRLGFPAVLVWGRLQVVSLLGDVREGETHGASLSDAGDRCRAELAFYFINQLNTVVTSKLVISD